MKRRITPVILIIVVVAGIILLGIRYVRTHSSILKPFVLNSVTKNDITDYLNSVYPSDNNSAFSVLTDRELYNFFNYLGFYWLSYHNNIKNIMHITDPDYPKNVFCGGYWNPREEKSCGEKIQRPIDDAWFRDKGNLWPTNSSCCKAGTLIQPAPMGALYFSDYLIRDIEIFRNGYDYKNLMNSVIYDPVYLYRMGFLDLDDVMNHLPLIKDGMDGSGKNLSYKCCDKSPTYDFTKFGPGYASNTYVEVSRDTGGGGAPSTFFYIAAGSGNFLDLGTTLRSLNKIHATLLMIRRAGELGFGSLTFWGMQGYSRTPQKVTLADGVTINNTFIEAPQMLLLELMIACNYDYSMNNPGNDIGFGEKVAKQVASDVNWPFAKDGIGWNGKAGYPHTYVDVHIEPLLTWFFLINGQTIPNFYDWSWYNWSSKDIEILGRFMDAATVPAFKQWELNYCFSKLSNSDKPDKILYQLINPQKSEISHSTPIYDVNPRDVNGQPFEGVYFPGAKYINTVSFATQPSGSGNWAYELVDYRLNLGVANKRGTPETIKKYMTEYSEKFMKVGDPLNKADLEPCDVIFCDDSGKYCETGSKTPLNWRLMICHQSKQQQMLFTNSM